MQVSEKYFQRTLLVIGLALFFLFRSQAYSSNVLGISTQSVDSAVVQIADPLATKIQLITTTAFDQMEVEEYEIIPYTTQYRNNGSMEYGMESVVQVGVNGVKTLTYLVTHWQDEIIDKTLLATQEDPPIPEVIDKGTKVIWRTYETPDAGEIEYWYKFTVWATKYDANCLGCWGRTFSGTEVKKGVCAVDPKVIQLGTYFYVDGYGMCHAEDIGGAIKGNRIDLGFKDASKGNWGAGYTTVYLITSAPQ